MCMYLGKYWDSSLRHVSQFALGFCKESNNEFDLYLNNDSSPPK